MLVVSHALVKDYPNLESTWRDLENRSNNSVFCSWSWINNMICLDEINMNVLTARNENLVVGLCLFKTKNSKMVNLFTIKQCFINRHGNDKLDQIWIEYNDFLVDTSLNIPIKKAMLDYLFEHKLADEVMLGMTDVKSKNEILSAECSDIKTRVVIQSQGFIANLAFYSSLEQYLNSLSKNTRSQIKRTEKLIKQLGTIEFIEAISLEDKINFFNQAGAIHCERWESNEFGSGFNNPMFINFHQKLLSEPKKGNVTKIFKLSLNHNTLGFIYILIEDGKWLFYLSAIKFHRDNRIKIGLFFHSLVIEQAITANVQFYDFLAGTARYKKSLSNVEHYEQQLICFYKPRLKFQLINQCREFKQKLNSLFKKLSNQNTQSPIEQ